MEKILLDDSLAKKRRTKTLCKTHKKDQLRELDELPTQSIRETHTVKTFNKKTQKIPFLNMANLRHMERPRFLSLEHRSPGKLHTQRDESQGSESKASFFAQESQLKLSQNTLNYKNQGQSQISRKACIFPPIDQYKQTMPTAWQKPPQNLENFVEPRRKKSKQNTHCKVLLARSNHFPFIGNHLNEMKKTDSLSSKQTHNTERDCENPQLFDLDISRINEVQEPSTPIIFTKDGFSQIAIF